MSNLNFTPALEINFTKSTMNYNELLEEITKSIKDKFEKNELAYLALTSKIENVLRDKIAFEFHQRVGNEKLVCREWSNNGKVKQKADIAILNREAKPEFIIEFKAHSSIKGIGEWAKNLKKDYQKNNILHPESEVVFVLFANHIFELPDDSVYKNSIKYYQSIKKSTLKKYSTLDQLNDWKNSLKKNNIEYDLVDFKIDAGEYHKKQVTINTFIHKNIKI
jgi:hypothetical protein